MKTIENIIKVLSSSIVTFLSSFIIGFVLPLYLSVAEYGYYREFILYFNFFYILNFGFNEGLYIKYGGKSLKSINHDALVKEHNFTIMFQLIVSTIIFILGMSLQNTTILFFSIATFFANVSYFHMLVDQALSEFSNFSKANVVKGLSTVITIVFVILIFSSEDHLDYIIAMTAAQLMLFLYTELSFFKRLPSQAFSIKKFLSFENIIFTFKIGIFIMGANFLRVLVGNIGQWLVNIFGDIENFAFYSLAGSMLSVVLLVVNAIASVFYSLIAKNDDPTQLVIIKNVLIIFGVISGLSYFAVYFAIHLILPAYVPSIAFMRYLILSIPYLMVVNIIITNLYKTKTSEKTYFMHMLVVILLSIGTISALIFFTGNIIGAAIGTSLIYIIWFMSVTRVTFPFLKNTLKFDGILLSHFIMYLISTYIPVVYGMTVYLVYVLVLFFIVKDDLLSLISKYKPLKKEV